VIEDSVILVTGAAGFIGSHLCRELAEKKPKKIIALDSLNYGSWSNLNNSSNIEKFKADLTNLNDNDFDDLLKDVDYVFHLAAEKHNQSKNTPQRVIDVNISATYKLVQASARAEIKKFVFTSSLYAYGMMNSIGMSEDEICNPHTLYGISKLAGEHFLNEFAQSHNLNFNIARLFFTYGTHQYSGTGYKSVIISNFEKILQGKRPTIYGSGQQRLDYINIKDVINSLFILSTNHTNRDVFNIGSGVGTTIEDLTNLMLDVSGSSLEPLYCPPDWTEGSSRVSNPHKAMTKLNWKPKVELKEGLQEVFNWMQNNVKQI
jgi:UDP-glucose 4-epimerase